MTVKLTLKSFVAAASIAVLGFTAPLAAAATAADGMWLRTKSGGEVEVFECEGGLGMKVTKSDTPEKVGKQIMCGAEADGENKWRGDILNLDDGKTYTGIVTLDDADNLTLEGCVLGGLICKEEAWTRIK
ncbi:MAG: DUF2147 domain-containing protein [Pseudomonadota bacterium]